MNEHIREAPSGQIAAVRPRRRLPGIDPLLRWRLYPRIFHWPLFAAMVTLVYFAFAPGQRGEGNLATEVVWRLWWPGLAFALLLGGRIWCGICPFGGVADAAGKVSGKRPAPPHAFRVVAPWLGVFSVLGFGMSFLALGLEANAGATGVILIGMTALAFGLSAAFRGRSFCRYLCPVGMITRVYSYFSWLRPLGSPKSEGKTAVCPVGQSPASLRQPSHCQLCGACTSTSEMRGITTRVVPASPRIPGVQEFGRPEAVLSLLLLGLMASDSIRMTQVFARYQHLALPYLGYNYRLSVIVGVAGLTGAIFLIQVLASRLGGRRITAAGSAPATAGPELMADAAGGSSHRNGFTTFNAIGFTYLPLTMAVFLSLALQHLWSGALPSLQTILVESRLIDWSGHMPPANVYFVSLPLKGLQLALLGLGLYFSMSLARKHLTRRGTAGRSIMVLTAFAGFGLLFLLPMSGAC